MRHPLKEVEEIRKKMDSLGLEMGIFVANPGGWKSGPDPGGRDPSLPPLRGSETSGLVDPSHRNAFLTEIKQSIDYHKVIGNRSVTILVGPAMPGVSRSAQRRSVIEGLKRGAELLEKTELTMVVETLNPFEHRGFFMTHSGLAGVNYPGRPPR